MLPGTDGRLFARAILADGTTHPVDLISVAGDTAQFWHAEAGGFGLPEFVRRHAQAFGEGTVERLRRMTVAVIGCSGTGGPLSTGE
jgi:hypothetical protein